MKHLCYFLSLFLTLLNHKITLASNSSSTKSPSGSFSPSPSNNSSTKSPSGSFSPSPSGSFSRSPSPSGSFSPSPSGSFSPTFDWGFDTGTFGDPHIITFDGLRFDCQASGEFISMTSLETPEFMIQERFSSASTNDCSQASVSTGVAIGDAGINTVQLSTPRDGSTNALNQVSVGSETCFIDFYHDGVQKNFSDDLQDQSINVSQNGSLIIILHPMTGLKVVVNVQHSSNFGCNFLVQVGFPGNYRSGETILGLMGTPNGNTNDDWRAIDGTILSIPQTENDRMFEPAYNYCTDNWCIRNPVNSLFTYQAGETFNDISKCDEAYDNSIEVALANPSQALIDICGTNKFCLVDGSCGDLQDAATVLQNEQLVKLGVTPSKSPTVSPTPSPKLKKVKTKNIKISKAPKMKGTKAKLMKIKRV